MLLFREIYELRAGNPYLSPKNIEAKGWGALNLREALAATPPRLLLKALPRYQFRLENGANGARAPPNHGLPQRTLLLCFFSLGAPLLLLAGDSLR